MILSEAYCSSLSHYWLLCFGNCCVVVVVPSSFFLSLFISALSSQSFLLRLLAQSLLAAISSSLSVSLCIIQSTNHHQTRSFLPFSAHFLVFLSLQHLTSKNWSCLSNFPSAPFLLPTSKQTNNKNDLWQPHLHLLCNHQVQQLHSPLITYFYFCHFILTIFFQLSRIELPNECVIIDKYAINKMQKNKNSSNWVM